MLRRTAHDLATFLLLILLLLVLVPDLGHAQIPPANLGKPTPDAQGTIVANVQSTLGALPPTADCALPIIPGSGPYSVAFSASADHNAVEQSVALLSHYEFVVTAPSQQEPCYRAAVRAVGPGGSALSTSVPFRLAVRAPAASGAPGVSRSSSLSGSPSPAIRREP